MPPTLATDQARTNLRSIFEVLKKPFSWPFRQGLVVIPLLALLSGCQPKKVAQEATNAMTLVKEGKPQATIIIAKEPSKTTLFAVKELNEHLELVTGAKLPVVDDATEVKGPRVLVGESDATRALGINTADFQHQEYLVRATADTLVLQIGRAHV